VETVTKTEISQLNKFLSMKHTDKILNEFLKNIPSYIHKIDERIVFSEEWTCCVWELFKSDNGKKFKIQYYITIGHRDPIDMTLTEVKE